MVKAREASRIALDRLEQARLAQEEENSKQAQRIAAERENVRRVLAEREAAKRQQAEAIRAAAAEAEREAQIQAEREMEEKQDLIRQLRALDKAREKHVKTIDPTYTPQTGLLGEMSLLELRERVQQMKTRNEEEEEERRQQILREKEDRGEMLMLKAEHVGKARRLAHAQALLR